MAASPKIVEMSFETGRRSEEHTSELQSRLHLVCRLLLEKKKKEAENYRPLVTPSLVLQETRPKCSPSSFDIIHVVLESDTSGIGRHRLRRTGTPRVRASY